MNLLSQIESILFVASKPLSVAKIAKATSKSKGDVEEAIENLKLKYNRDDSGIHVLFESGDVQMATNPHNAEVVDGFIKDEVSGELTKAQLETLTVVAYRGPVTRPELEQIRGVNCAVILRNLMVRGLVEEKNDDKEIVPVYTLSFDALRHLGITDPSQLPEYDTLHAHEFIEAALADAAVQSE